MDLVNEVKSLAESKRQDAVKRYIEILLSEDEYTSETADEMVALLDTLGRSVNELSDDKTLLLELKRQETLSSRLEALCESERAEKSAMRAVDEWFKKEQTRIHTEADERRKSIAVKYNPMKANAGEIRGAGSKAIDLQRQLHDRGLPV